MKTTYSKLLKRERRLKISSAIFLLLALFALAGVAYITNTANLNPIAFLILFCLAIIFTIAGIILSNKYNNLRPIRLKLESKLKFLELQDVFLKEFANTTPTSSKVSKEIFLKGAEAAIKSGCYMDFIEEELKAH